VSGQNSEFGIRNSEFGIIGARKMSLHQGVLPAIWGAPADKLLLRDFEFRISNFGFFGAGSSANRSQDLPALHLCGFSDFNIDSNFEF